MPDAKPESPRNAPPERERPEDIGADGGGQQTKVGRPYDGSGDVQRPRPDVAQPSGR